VNVNCYCLHIMQPQADIAPVVCEQPQTDVVCDTPAVTTTTTVTVIEEQNVDDKVVIECVTNEVTAAVVVDVAPVVDQHMGDDDAPQVCVLCLYLYLIVYRLRLQRLCHRCWPLLLRMPMRQQLLVLLLIRFRCVCC
jgi:hypothetical protein